jgi:hypothetical protein
MLERRWSSQWWKTWRSEMRMRGGRCGRAGNIPAVAELCADLLKLVIPHVLDAEDEAVLVLIGGFADVGVEFRGEHFALLLDLGQVHHARTL